MVRRDPCVRLDGARPRARQAARHHLTRPILIALVAAAVLIWAAGCAPGRDNVGWTGAQAAGGYGSVTIAEQPVFWLGDPANGGAGFWNQAAGRPLLVRSDANPQITFVAGGPFITPPAFGSRRVVTYIDWDRNPDGSLSHCTVFYDPSYVASGVPFRHLNFRVFAHEIGHCLDLAGEQPCSAFTGVMANCNFWARVIAGEGPGPADTAQLRAAGYIP